MNRIVVGFLAVALAACTPAVGPGGVPEGDGPLIGIYKTTIDDGNGSLRRVRLSLWAEDPNRLHAELIAPVGGVLFILDAGRGAACVVDVAEATAYVGDDAPAALGALVGVRVSAADVVAALLHGAAPEGLIVSRIGEADGTLPESFKVADGARSISLSRIRFERGTKIGGELGTGAPPRGLRTVPIERLAP